jgi:CRISPR-associated endoribonuclease Cas6
MIKRYAMQLESGDILGNDRGYRLYGALMAVLENSEYGALMHEQEITPISQYFVGSGLKRGDWVINLLNDTAIENFGEALNAMENLRLNRPGADVRIVSKQCETVPGARDLFIMAEKNLKPDRFVFNFRTSASFKSGGEYALFPSAEWIVNSLVSKWNIAWPLSAIADGDAVAALIRGLRITSYKLRSSYYPVKGVKIPGFTGEITLLARMPAALLELARPLFYFGRYSGVGIKTALGMGAVEVKRPANA